LNAGGGKARGEWVWFLHADSRIGAACVAQVEQVTAKGKPALHYFQLQFAGGPGLMRLNQWGANWRSRRLEMPFGDQGFLLPRALWKSLGTFRTDAKYGEDHLFAWSAKKMGIPLIGLPGPLVTSARKYRDRGWSKTTLWTLQATYRQALWEALDLFSLISPFRDPRPALAIFVKTPELSPVKTRLAASSSPETARDFYEHSIEAMSAMALRAAAVHGVVPYWSIAEAQGMQSPRWAGFSRVFQGEGALGDRLHTVYHQLLRRHSRVLLIGCDCPHLSAKEIGEACHQLENKPFVVGPADDGGYYLFGGTKPLERGTWNAVPYSVSETLACFRELLSPIGKVGELRTLSDVDSVTDLIKLKHHLEKAALKKFPAPQRAALSAILALRPTTHRKKTRKSL
jgi:rSAM/selenodomain-associated transferase 1